MMRALLVAAILAAVVPVARAQAPADKPAGDLVLTPAPGAVLPAPVPAADWRTRFDIKPVGTLELSYTPYNQQPPKRVVEYPGGPERERNFALRFAEIGLAGSMWVPWLTFRAALSAEQTSRSTMMVGVSDVFVKLRWAPASRTGTAFIPFTGVTVGAMMVPFSRQNLVSEALLQLTSRSVTISEIEIRRDIGATVDVEYEFGGGRAVLYVRGGVFNGQGNRIYGFDNNANLMYTGRAWIDLFGRMAPGEGDARANWWEPGYGARMFTLDAFRLSLGASVLKNYDIDREVTAWGADAEFRWAGFALTAEYLDARYKTRFGSDITDPLFSSRWGRKGYYVQAGAYLIPGWLEVAGRYERYTIDVLGEPGRERTIEQAVAGLTGQVVTPVGRVRLMLNYTHRRERAGLPAVPNDSLTLQLLYRF